MALKNISSPTHDSVKEVVRLHKADERRETGKCIVEGIRSISTINQKWQLVSLFCAEAMVKDALNIASDSKIIVVTDAVMKKMSTATTPSGLLGVFKIPQPPSPKKLSPGLVLAQVSDPGNMGTLIRTAAACGVNSIIIIEGVDPWSPKVIQASVGTIALVTIFEWDWKTLIAHKGNLKLYGLVVEGGNKIHAVDSKQALLVVGNEAKGIPAEWLKDCDVQITLPMPGNTESLNAAVAGSIALYLVFVNYR